MAVPLNSSFSDEFFVFVFECCTLLVSRVFRVSARVLARVFNNKRKDTERDTRHLRPLPHTPSCATELLSSPWHPLSDLATQPIRRPDRTPLARLGPLAPCATEPLTGDLDSVGSVDFLFPCFLCCLFRQLVLFCMPLQAAFSYLFFGCVIRVVYGIWLRVWTHVRVRGWIGQKLATCVDACHVAS